MIYRTRDIDGVYYGVSEEIASVFTVHQCSDEDDDTIVMTVCFNRVEAILAAEVLVNDFEALLLQMARPHLTTVVQCERPVFRTRVPAGSSHLELRVVRHPISRDWHLLVTGQIRPLAVFDSSQRALEAAMRLSRIYGASDDDDRAAGSGDTRV